MWRKKQHVERIWKNRFWYMFEGAWYWCVRHCLPNVNCTYYILFSLILPASGRWAANKSEDFWGQKIIVIQREVGAEFFTTSTAGMTVDNICFKPWQGIFWLIKNLPRLILRNFAISQKVALTAWFDCSNCPSGTRLRPKGLSWTNFCRMQIAFRLPGASLRHPIIFSNTRNST